MEQLPKATGVHLKTVSQALSTRAFASCTLTLRGVTENYLNCAIDKGLRLPQVIDFACKQLPVAQWVPRIAHGTPTPQRERSHSNSHSSTIILKATLKESHSQHNPLIIAHKYSSTVTSNQRELEELTPKQYPQVLLTTKE